METENYCWVPRFPLMARSYKVVGNQTFMLC